MQKQEDKPYLEAPVKSKETTKEQMIYGSGETLVEVEKDREEKKKKLLTEGM